MNKKLFDLCVVTSCYTQNGQKKNRYENIGSIWEKDGKPFMILKAHFNPAAIARKEGEESILVSMFPPKDNSNSSNANNSKESSSSSKPQEHWDGNIHNAGYSTDGDNGTYIPF